VICSILKAGSSVVCYRDLSLLALEVLTEPLGRPSQRWVDNIKMDLVGIEWGGVDWIGLTQDRDKSRALVIAVMNLRAPEHAGKLSSGHTIGGPSSSAQLRIVS
jgi:hypothetical protein